MSRTVAGGIQDFETVITDDNGKAMHDFGKDLFTV